MNPYENEELYNSIRLAGVQSPGTVTLSGFGRAVAWDVKKGGAQDGASTTRQGNEPASGHATFYLAYDPVSRENDFERWESEFLPLLKSTFDRKAPRALDIYHPDLAMLGIKSVVVKKIGVLQHDGMGGATVSVELLEYSPPKKKPASKPAGSASKPVKPTKPDPNAAAKAKLRELLHVAAGGTGTRINEE